MPAFYVHSAQVERDRKAYVERIYEALNDAGAALPPAAAAAVAAEAQAAFAHNAACYKEGPGGGGAGMLAMAALGGARVLGGYAADRLLRGGRRDVFGRLRPN